VELRHLRYFVAIAEERSFSRAAERLSIAQPPLSQQIRRLEAELGFPLFERKPHGVALTRAGEVLLGRARAILLACSEAAADAEAAHRGVAGRLKLAFINSAAYDVLPRLLMAFRKAHPDIEVGVREMIIADQLDALADGSIDAGILRPPVDDARLDALLLAREPFVVALPRGHALRSRSSLTLRDLADEALIAYPRGHPAGFRERIDAALRALGSTPRIVQEATQVHTICGLVAGGVGISIVPIGAQVLAIEGIGFVSLRAPDLYADIWLAWPRQSQLPQLQHFVAVARNVAR
jgi:DNA-binding transcriptional LysR family regulator